MDYSYPLLQKVFEFYKSKPHNLSNIHLICCQHLLEPQLKMFEYFIEFGFSPQNIILLGKAYSANNDVAAELKKRGIDVRLSPFLGPSFTEEHHANCISVLSSLPSDVKNIVLLDDGAELIKVFSDNKKEVLFGVEQTSSGFRKLEKVVLNFPVINVARSSVKLTQESPFIARLAFERIQTYISEKNIVNPPVLVVGLGPIGKSIVEILVENNIIVTGFDIKHGHTHLLNTIKTVQPTLIIGATGSRILDEHDIEALVSDQALHLISVSSSDLEFPVAKFRKDDMSLHGDVRYKNLIFVNNGFPITFKGNRYELAPIEIEKTICLLGGSVAYGATHDISSEKGIIEVPKELEELIIS